MNLPNIIKKVIGAAKPPTINEWDGQYKNGGWDFLNSIEELGRYSIITGYYKFFKKGGSILDVGCGSGTLQRIIKNFNYSYYFGIDFSAEAIQKAKENQDEKTIFETADMNVFSTEKKFDVIIFNESIYYVKPTDIMKKYSSYLKKDGIFIVSMFQGKKRGVKRWKKIESLFEIIDGTQVTNKFGNSWKCKVFQNKILL